MSRFPQELLDLFADEAATRLGRMSEQLLELEQGAEVVDSVFRDAHTLKGSAGMMGFSAFAQVAHRMEDLLHGVRDGSRPPTPALVDALLAAVDGLRRHLPAVVAGAGDETALAELEVRLVAAGEQPAEPVAPAEPADRAESVAPAGRPVAADDVARIPLHRLDEMARLAGEAGAAHARLLHALRLGADAALPPEAHALGVLLRDLEARTAQARTLPLAAVLEPLRRTVRDVARAQNKAVRLDVEGEDVELDRGVLDRLSGALLHLVRNAVDHGVEEPVDRVQQGKKAQGVVTVSARQRGRGVVVTVSDDGRGIDLDKVRAAADAPDLTDEEAISRLFDAGFSTAGSVTALSGRGVGLDVVRAALAPVRGKVEVRTVKGKGTTFVLDVPLTVAAVPSVLVRCDGRQYAVALSAVEATRAPEPGDVPLGAVLGLPVLPPSATVVLRGEGGQTGVSVDELVAERDVVVKSVGALPEVAVVAGAAIDVDGTVLVVLDPVAVVEAASGLAAEEHPPAPPAPTPREEGPGNRVLVIDDDAVMCEAQRNILARAGYEVRTAADGIEALEALRHWSADLAVVDIEMPRMNGIDLTRAIRDDPMLRSTAVLILTSLGSESDRRRGMEAGADGYIVKGTYNDEGLAATVARLLGREA